jgi:hypothetical protein
LRHSLQLKWRAGRDYDEEAHCGSDGESPHVERAQVPRCFSCCTVRKEGLGGRAEGSKGMSKPTLRISSREVLDDLRAGMDDAGLMEKYALTYRQLQRLFRKLILAELISPLELAERLCVTESQITETMEEMKKTLNETDRDAEE